MDEKTIYDAEGRCYQGFNARIIEVGKWQKTTKWKERDATYLRERVFGYSGVSGFYNVGSEKLGPRLDIDLEIEHCPFFDEFIEINVYPEIMSILGYLRMSPQLVESIEANVGRSIRVYVADKQHVYFDVRELMSLNYGYRWPV